MKLTKILKEIEAVQPLKITKDSHVDHGLSQDQIEYIQKYFAGRDKFFIETIDLPSALGKVPCGLHGPIMGDEPISEEEVTYKQRGGRSNLSRMVARKPRMVSKVTVIAGPHNEDACILYTAFGGPLAPQEVDDPNNKDKEKSKQFWSQHALSLE